MTESELITSLKNRSEAFKGTSGDSISEIIESALSEYSLYNPRVIHSLENEVNDNGIYDTPDNFIAIRQVIDSVTENPIDFEVKENPEGNIRLYLGRRQVPSTQHLEEQDYYESPSNLSYLFIGSGYQYFDIVYTVPVTVPSLSVEGVRDVKLYAEYLGLQSKASDISKLIDITESDPAGESTTIRYSGQAKLYHDLADKKLNEFNMNVEKPVGVRSGVFSDRRPRNYRLI